MKFIAVLLFFLLINDAEAFTQSSNIEVSILDKNVFKAVIGGSLTASNNESTEFEIFRELQNNPIVPGAYEITQSDLREILSVFVLFFHVKKFKVSIGVENLFGNNNYEVQLISDQKIKNETNPVTELRLTPGTPRYVKAGISFQF